MTEDELKCALLDIARGIENCRDAVSDARVRYTPKLTAYTKLATYTDKMCANAGAVGQLRALAEMPARIDGHLSAYAPMLIADVKICATMAAIASGEVGASREYVRTIEHVSRTLASAASALIEIDRGVLAPDEDTEDAVIASDTDETEQES